MGIVNITPDSFFEGSRCNTEKEIIESARRMINDGASFLDLGAYSTRPGAAEVSVSDEIERLDFAMNAIRAHFPSVPISIDTFRSEVAKEIISKHGPCIINDISGGTLDSNMFATVAELKVPYILMHIKGTPQNMQENPTYEDVFKETLHFLSERVATLRSMGVADIIIDPGFGFGKDIDHNYQLLNKLDGFKILEAPILVGISRKSMIYKPLNISPQEALNGTTVINTMSLIQGANILRVHDVKEAVECVQIVSMTKCFK
ncbi:dihydropteroate synthase [Halosquirtibacter laminarini]|uniref:Dihydropteroate synthase n=2 Tax=Halosquirtibacter laminarini TaxID=3374600 RepID=A0AC61NRE0_9BACT|nr:dihydropteroate synthase [Prolixibacteraceae bacterium]